MRPTALLAIVPFVFFAKLASAQSITPEQKAKTLDGMQKIILSSAFVPGVDFSQWPSYLEKRKPQLEKATEVPAFVNVVNGALRDFGISHIRMLSPQSAKTRQTGRVEGFGVAVQQVADGLLITQVVPKSAAERIGLVKGDLITEVEGKPNPTVIQLGPFNDTTLLTVRRKETGRVQHMMVLKTEYSTDRVETLTWPTKDTAVLTIPSFSRSYSQANVEKLVAEASKGKALILDLRGNPGGFVANCNHLISLLSTPGTPTGTNVGRNMAERFVTETGGDPKDMAAIAKWSGAQGRTRAPKILPYLGKLAVILNNRSASASEITAVVLKEERNAVLVGKPSAGAVLVSVFRPIAGTDFFTKGTNFEVQIPLSDYISPRGRRLEKNPLQPDVPVTETATSESESDPVVLAALKAVQ